MLKLAKIWDTHLRLPLCLYLLEECFSCLVTKSAFGSLAQDGGEPQWRFTKTPEPSLSVECERCCLGVALVSVTPRLRGAGI